jgi:SSS family solute:Na+ symporter
MGSIVTLVTGSITGLLVFVFDFTGKLNSFKADYPAFEFLNFMVISFILSMICAVIIVVVSLAYPEPITEEKRKLVWRCFSEPLREKGWPGIGNYKFLSAALALTMIGLYVIFTWFVN